MCNLNSSTLLPRTSAPVNLKVDDMTTTLKSQQQQQLLHTVEESSTMAAKCDPARTTLKHELILQ